MPMVLLVGGALAVYAQEQGTRERVSSKISVAVGADGSMHRIANWNELSQQERVAAQRALAKAGIAQHDSKSRLHPKGGSGSGCPSVSCKELCFLRNVGCRAAPRRPAASCHPWTLPLISCRK